MISQILLRHGPVPYRYMVHKAKLDLTTSTLKSFLRLAFANCPNEPFLSGSRSSALKFDMGIVPRRIDEHEVCIFAKEGLAWNRYKTAHENVEGFMLFKDSSTVAVEVPVWLEIDEMQGLGIKGPLSGHIDILRYCDGKAWIWDYKPKAAKEKYATTQLFHYALMLSKRARIDLAKITCGYFDEHTAFVFNPDASAYILPPAQKSSSPSF